MADHTPGFHDNQKTLNLFRELPDKLAAKTLGNALKAAITVIGEEIKGRTPTDTGLLKANAGTAVQVDKTTKIGYAGFGFGKQQYIADWVERGHRIVAHKPKKTDTGQHVPAHPFQGPGFDAVEEQALQAFADTLIADLERIWKEQ